MKNVKLYEVADERMRVGTKRLNMKLMKFYELMKLYEVE